MGHFFEERGISLMGSLALQKGHGFSFFCLARFVRKKWPIFRVESYFDEWGIPFF